MKRLLLLSALALAVLLAVAGLPVLVADPAVAAPPTAAQSLFVPLDPSRLLDTRSGTGGRIGALGPGATVDLQVVGGLVPAGATSALINVTAVGPTAATDVRAYPTPAGGAPVPTVSNLNAPAGATVAGLVSVKVGDGGRVRLRNQAGSVHLVADLSGYTIPAQTGSTYVPRAPVRLLDTRDAVALGPGEVRALEVTRTRAGAASGVPAGATAVALNLTAVGPSESTDVRAYPTRTGGAVPTVSNLNASRGQTVPNLVVVAVGELSQVSLRNAAGSTHLIADLAGWWTGDDSASAFHPLDPVRLADTRSGPPVGPGGTRDVVVAGVGRVPAQATAVVLTVTAVGATGASDVRAYPAGTGEVPTVSNLNVVAGRTVANAVVVPIGADGSVRLRNAQGSVHLVVDLAGFWSPTGDGWDLSWPQCSARGSTTSRLPGPGAFAVVGLTRGAPFGSRTDASFEPFNECFDEQWAWASSLPGEPSVYLNVNAPGVRATPDGEVWNEVCGTATATSSCGSAYGSRIAQHVLPELPTTPSGGRPMVWLDVEGPYANGPFWQLEQTSDPLVGPNPNAVAVNRAVIGALVDGLRGAGYRVGIYSDRGSVAGLSNDWRNIVGDWRLLQTQNWVFRSPTADPQAVCGEVHSFSGGPVVMAQVQPATNPGVSYDVNGLC